MTPEIQWFKTSDLRNLIFDPFNNCILILLVLDTGGSEMTDELELCQVCMYIKNSQDVLWFFGVFLHGINVWKIMSEVWLVVWF